MMGGILFPPLTGRMWHDILLVTLITVTDLLSDTHIIIYQAEMIYF